MRDAVMIGGGGHAMSCLDAADSGDLRFVGYVAPTADPALPLAYLGDDAELPEIRRSGVELAFVALGDNTRRCEVVRGVEGLGFELATVIASTARVSGHASVGPGAVVMHGAFVGPRSQIGTAAVVNTAASVDHDCTVGDFSHIAPGTHLAGGVRMGEGAFAGVGVSVIPNTEVGAWAVVGAAAAVVRDVPAKCTVVGVPARARRQS